MDYDVIMGVVCSGYFGKVGGKFSYIILFFRIVIDFFYVKSLSWNGGEFILCFIFLDFGGDNYFWELFNIFF